MESLRRLTSSVFESGHARLGRRQSGSGISAFLPGALGGGNDPASALDLTFITEQLIVSGFPVTSASNKRANEINVDELAQYLETYHSSHYLIFNLNALDASDAPSSACASPAVGASNSIGDSASASLIEQLWRKAPQLSSSASSSSYDAHAIAAKVREQMLEFSWERDGMKAHTPPFDLIFRICYSIFAWLALDSQNVAVINCQSGKTRSGVVVACYLLFARLADDPIAAFVAFYRKRWDMRTLTPEALRSKTPPSIQRFLASFYALVESQQPPHADPMVLKAIIFRALPLERQPSVQIWDDYRLVFCTDSTNSETVGQRDPPVLDWSSDDGFFAITWERGVELDGGFSILCSFGDEYDTNNANGTNDDAVDATSRVLFRYADSTWFLRPGLVTLTKRELDMMRQYEHGFDDDQFSVDLVLHDHVSAAAPGRTTSALTPARRSHVRLDYTGNNAVQQGLLEITKHHVVLPDPAMHSNFLRMGFAATPATFALQRSQNAPNVALDLLHSEALAACFVRGPVASIDDLVSTVSTEPESRELSSALSSERMPAGEATTHVSPQRRQTTAEINAMQSQRTRFASTSSSGLDAAAVCCVCRNDDYMLRPQVVQCVGACRRSYHTTCVGLRKIPFGLTTMSDRTNHSVYVKKFFSAWECDACAPPPLVSSVSTLVPVTTGGIGDVPPGMALVPAAWASSYAPSPLAPNKQQQLDASSGSSVATALAAATTPATAGAPVSPVDESDAAKMDKLREFLLASGVSVDDLLRAATTPNVSIGTMSPTPPVRTDSDARDGLPSATNESVRELQRASLDSSRGDSARDPASTRTAEEQGGHEPAVRPTAAHSDAKHSELVAGSSRGLSVDLVNTTTATAASVAAAATISRGDLLKQIAARSAAATAAPPASAAPSAARPPVDLKTALLRDIVTKRSQDDGVDTTTNSSPSDTQAAVNTSHNATETTDVAASDTNRSAPTKYETMLQRGVPFAAVQNCMVKDGADPSTLQPLLASGQPADDSTIAPTQLRLRDVDEFQRYFSMLRLGCPKEAVKHKLVMDGLDPLVVDFGPDAIYDDVKHKLTSALPVDARSSLQHDIASVRKPAAAVSDSVAVTATISDKAAIDAVNIPISDSLTTATIPDDTANSNVLLKDDATYSKYFRMLKMGLPEDAVRHKIKTDGANVRALDLGPDASLASLLTEPTLGDDVTYSKYFKMRKMGLPDGAVRHKMVTDGVDVRALDLGPDALVSALVGSAHAGTTSSSTAATLKPTARRKKLHWQAISDDRLSSMSQQTIWEETRSDDDTIAFDVDMDELESLFFADTNSSGGTNKKKSASNTKALKRKQRVTLVDAKRAMNAAISLARVKLSYSEIATAIETFDARGLTLEQLVGLSEFLPTPEEVAVVTAYTGDIAALGEAEKFMREMARVERCAARTECLVFTLAFASRRAELAASYTNMQTASDEVKSSRLLKVLLSMVLKLGNSLNGSGDDTGIRGFTVDSLLRLGHTKAVNQKTTVLHYLVRLVKKNHRAVLDFHDELRCVSLAARESFDAIADDFAKLQAGAAKLETELQVLEAEVASDIGTNGTSGDTKRNDANQATVKAMRVAAESIELQIKSLRDEIARARDEVRSVFDYFGEDPAKSPTEFFATLTSFCAAFEAARKEVDAADEAAQRAERMKLRRSNSVAPRPQLKTAMDTGDLTAAALTTSADTNSSAFELRLRDRTHSDRFSAIATARQNAQSRATDS